MATLLPEHSRRDLKLSIGINLNPDKLCNFDCVYCQVDRQTPPVVRDVDVPRLRQELEDMLDCVQGGALFERERFRATPPHLRRLNDLAFSGDGEPTTCPALGEAVAQAAEVRRQRGLDAVKLVLITNASRLHDPRVRRVLGVLDANNGEVWAKLDAGTEAYYRRVGRTTVPFAQVVRNITETAQVRPVVIQALFLRMHGEPPPAPERKAFCSRLKDVLAAGGQVKRVQVYTVARKPAEPWVAALSDDEVDAIAEQVRRETGLRAEAFYAGSES
jgi:wyosine [tRNA(Phe)-imidazoG37] synthetase (radical SAM superfamily)